ncbi:MAG: hypothetical protein U9N42_08415 [Campylobacterota bacterium]|nr:hypothetical protein [Campylobacterota bacterium]
MQINSYTFDSPSSNQFQIGKLDTSKKQEEENSQLATATNETLKEAKSFENSQKQEVEPTVSSSGLLDVYA